MDRMAELVNEPISLSSLPNNSDLVPAIPASSSSNASILRWKAESRIVDSMTPFFCNRLDCRTISRYVTQRCILSSQQNEELLLQTLTNTAKNEKLLSFLKTNCDTPATTMLAVLRQVQEDECLVALEDVISQLTTQLDRLPEMIEELKQQANYTVAQPARGGRSILASFTDSTYHSMEHMPTVQVNLIAESHPFSTMPRRVHRQITHDKRCRKYSVEQANEEDVCFRDDDSSEASTTVSVDDETRQMMEAYNCLCTEVAKNLDEISNIKLVRLYLRNELSQNRVPQLYNISLTDQDQLFSKNNDIFDMFEHLSNHTSWIDYQLITGLSRSLGEEKGGTLAEMYEGKLREYLNKRKNTIITSESREIIQVKLDWEWNEHHSHKQAKKFTSTISRFFGCEKSSLVIKSVTKGCVLITWSVPKELCHLIAYYSTLYCEFMNLLGVIWIKILGKRYTIKDYIPSLGSSAKIIPSMKFYAIQGKAHSLTSITGKNSTPSNPIETGSVWSLPANLHTICISNYFQKRERKFSQNSLTPRAMSSQSLLQSQESDSNALLPKLKKASSHQGIPEVVPTHDSAILDKSNWLVPQDSQLLQNASSSKEEAKPKKLGIASNEVQNYSHCVPSQERYENDDKNFLQMPFLVSRKLSNFSNISSGYNTMSSQSSRASDFSTFRRKARKTIECNVDFSEDKQTKKDEDRNMKEVSKAELIPTSTSLPAIQIPHHDDGFAEPHTSLSANYSHSSNLVSQKWLQSEDYSCSKEVYEAESYIPAMGSSTNPDIFHESILVSPSKRQPVLQLSRCSSYDEGYSTLGSAHTSSSGLILSRSSKTMPANLFMTVKQDYQDDKLQLRKGQIVKTIFQEDNQLHIQTRDGQHSSLPLQLCHLSLRYLKDKSKIATISKAYTKSQLPLGQPLLKDTAISSYRAVTNTELSVIAGAKLSVLLYDEDWVYCVTFDGRAGFIPRPHCLVLGQQVLPSIESDPISEAQNSASFLQNYYHLSWNSKNSISFSRLVLSKATPQSPANLIMTCTSDNQARSGDEITISKGQKVLALFCKGTRLLVRSGDQQGYVSERVCYLSSQYTNSSSKRSIICYRWVVKQLKPAIGYSNMQYIAKDKLELSVQRNQPLNILFSDKTWAYVVTQKRQSGFLPRSILETSKQEEKNSHVRHYSTINQH